jgi:dihydroflavonol-4-reductase
MGVDCRFWAGKRVGVTGGTGLLGFQIVRHLLAAGARPRVLALPPHPVHPLNRMPEVECIFGDVRDSAVVRSALGDCDVVFHAAGVVAVWGPALRAVHDVHVKGTRNLLACTGRDTRIVHTSSVVTVGATRGKETLDEASPFALGRLRIDYVHAKREAERIALDAAAAGRDVVVANPAFLVGPEDFERSLMGRFCRRYWRGQVPVAPPGGFNLVDARDAALGHLLAAERGRAGERYILGGENRTFPQFMDGLAKIGGMDPQGVPVVPWWTLAALARLAELRAAWNREQPYPAWQHVLLNRYHWFYRSERAERELGYACRPLDECLADTYRWCTAWNSLNVRGLNRWWMRPLERAA